MGEQEGSHMGVRCPREAPSLTVLARAQKGVGGAGESGVAEGNAGLA